MSFFGLLWTPFFLLFWIALAGKDRNLAGALRAFILGSLVTAVHYLAGPVLPPGEFGFSRWLSILVDLIFFPAVLPFIVAPVFPLFRRSGSADLRVFALVWLLPESVVRSISWSARGNPLFLVLLPLIWTALAAGIPLFAGLAARFRLPLAIPCVLAAAILPPLASFSFWAFFIQEPLPGFAALAVLLVPAAITVIGRLRRG